MAQWLKQSTSITAKIGPFLDENDGKTAEVGLTLTQADIRLSKNGGNIAQKNEANNATHDELGYYDCPLDGTDTGTLGRLLLAVHESGALPVWHEYMVVPANVWDSMFGADRLQVHVAEVTAGLVADDVLKRGVANVEATADVDSLAALILSKLHAAISGLVMTIYRTDDTTVFDTKDVVKDAAADPITSVADP